MAPETAPSIFALLPPPLGSGRKLEARDGARQIFASFFGCLHVRWILLRARWEEGWNMSCPRWNLPFPATNDSQFADFLPRRALGLLPLRGSGGPAGAPKRRGNKCAAPYRQRPRR